MDLTFVGWIVVGLIAGLFSGVVVGGRTARGWIPSLVIGVVSAFLVGWLLTTFAGVDSDHEHLALGAVRGGDRDGAPAAAQVVLVQRLSPAGRRRLAATR